jgi:hypothetical protein
MSRGGTAALRTIRMALVALGVLGCERTGDRISPDVITDSAQVSTSRPPDTTGEGLASSPDAELRTALERLLRGTAAPRADTTWFSTATEGALRNVTLDTNGHATVDFEDLRTLIPNASSSAGSQMLLDELNATVFGVAAVRSVDYLIEGRCERFWEWLQRGCQAVPRPPGP